jgi:hypothetical protein
MYCTLHPEEQATPTEQKHANNLQKNNNDLMQNQKLPCSQKKSKRTKH